MHAAHRPPGRGGRADGPHAGRYRRRRRHRDDHAGRRADHVRRADPRARPWGRGVEHLGGRARRLGPGPGRRRPRHVVATRVRRPRSDGDPVVGGAARGRPRPDGARHRGAGLRTQPGAGVRRRAGAGRRAGRGRALRHQGHGRGGVRAADHRAGRGRVPRRRGRRLAAPGRREPDPDAPRRRRAGGARRGRRRGAGPRPGRGGLRRRARGAARRQERRGAGCGHRAGGDRRAAGAVAGLRVGRRGRGSLVAGHPPAAVGRRPAGAHGLRRPVGRGRWRRRATATGREPAPSTPCSGATQERRVEVGAGDAALLVVAENFNAGWQARNLRRRAARARPGRGLEAGAGCCRPAAPRSSGSTTRRRRSTAGDSPAAASPRSCSSSWWLSASDAAAGPSRCRCPPSPPDDDRALARLGGLVGLLGGGGPGGAAGARRAGRRPAPAAGQGPARGGWRAAPVGPGHGVRPAVDAGRGRACPRRPPTSWGCWRWRSPSSASDPPGETTRRFLHQPVHQLGQRPASPPA